MRLVHGDANPGGPLAELRYCTLRSTDPSDFTGTKDSEHSVTYTAAMAHPAAALPEGLHIFPKTLSNRISTLFGVQDVKTGEEDFDSALMVEMAESCSGLLAAPPDIDLWDGLSAHDLN